MRDRLTIKKRFFKLIRVFGRDELFAEAYPCGVGGGMEGGDIDKGGVVDGEVFEVGYGDVFVVFVAEENGVALL